MPLTGNTDFFHGASGGSVDTDKIDTVDKSGGRNLEQFHIHGIVDVYLLSKCIIDGHRSDRLFRLNIDEVICRIRIETGPDGGNILPGA